MSAFFQEIQTLSGGWKTFVWLAGFIPTTGAGLWFAYAAYQQIVQGIPFGNDPVPDEVLVVIAVFLAVCAVGEAWFFRAMHLTTEVDEEQLSIRFFPLRTQTIRRTDIETCAVVRNTVLGVGKQTMLGETRYSMGGSEAVQVILKDGRKLMIGSQRAEQLVAALRAIPTITLAPELSAAEVWQVVQQQRIPTSGSRKR